MEQLAVSSMEPQVLAATPRYFRRIDLFHRLVHGCLMSSFIGLAATGMPIKFNAASWSANIAHAMGGFGTIIFFHKTFGVILVLSLGFAAGAVPAFQAGRLRIVDALRRN